MLCAVFTNSYPLLSSLLSLSLLGSCLACIHRVMDACGKFGEQERSIRVARGTVESKSSSSSALQTSRVHPYLNIHTLSMNQLSYIT